MAETTPKLSIPLVGGDSQDISKDRSDRLSTSWVKDKAGEYDVCMVFPSEAGDFTATGKQYIRKIFLLGFETYIYRGVSENPDIFVLIRTPLEKLRAFAESIDYTMKLDPSVVKRKIETGDPELNIAGRVIEHRPDITPLEPYQFIYGKYSTKVDESIYWRPEGSTNPFRSMIRLKLSTVMLESRVPDGSQNLKIRRYLRSGKLKACFPLHDRVRTEILQNKWMDYPFRGSQPFHEIKDYFGEKIALYFQFMSHYTEFLAIPAFVGIPMQIAVFATNDFSAPYLPVYSFFIALWAVCMLEFWKRKEKTIALTWGTINFEASEADRADFRGDKITSYIDGSEMVYFPTKTRFNYIVQSFFAVVGLVMLVAGVVVSIYVMRYAIVTDVGNSNAQTLASIVNAIQIQVLNYLYSLVANALSERENHRTETQFINSYASFFFLAFVAEWIGDCPDNGCIYSLSINLAIIFGIRLVSGNFFELLIPYLSYQYKFVRKYKSNSMFSRPEKEFMLEKYDTLSSSLEEYAESAIQFGYNSLFVAALPIASLFALISNIVEIKGDAWKLLNLYQRPFPKTAEDIGSWQSIFLILSVAAVITNAGLTTFTMTTFDDFSEAERYWVFILFQWVCFALQMFIMEAIPDIPEEIDIQLQRTEFIVRKLIDQVADDNEPNVSGTEKIVNFEKYPVGDGGFYQDNEGMFANMK